MCIESIEKERRPVAIFDLKIQSKSYFKSSVRVNIN